MSIRKALTPVVLGWLAIGALSRAAELPAKVDLYGDPLPPGAISRLGTVRFRQHGELKGVTYSADGRTLIGFAYESILLWDAESGKLRQALPIETHAVVHVAFSADRRQAVTAGFMRLPDDTLYSLQVWDLAEPRPLESFIWQGESPPGCVALNAAGTMLAAGDLRGTVRIYEVESQQELLSLQLGDRPVRALAFSPADERLVVGLESERPFLWNWPEGEDPQPLDEAYGWPRSVAWSPDGARFAVARDREDGVRLYDAASGQRLETLADEPGFSYVHNIAFSPDGRLLATADSGTRAVTIWNVETGAKIATHANRARSRSLSFSPDGRWLTDSSGMYHARLRKWNVDTGQMLLANVGHDEIPSSIEFLPGDEVVATAGDDGTLRFWDVEGGRQLRMAAHRQGDTDEEDATLWIRAMDISPDGRLAATSSQDGTLRVWDVATAEEIFRLHGHGRVGGRRVARFTPDSSQLVSCGDDFFLRIWDIRTGKAVAEHPLRPSGANLPENEDGTLQTFYGAGPMMGPSAISPDGQHLVLGMESTNGFHVFDIQSGRELSNVAAGEQPIHSMALSPDAKHIVTAYLGRRVRTQLRGGGERSELAGEFEVQLSTFPEGHKVRGWTLEGRLSGPVAFGLDGAIFAVATWEIGKPVRVYETASGRLLAEIDGFNGYPWAMAFSNDGDLLATSLTSGSVLIWNWRQFAK